MNKISTYLKIAYDSLRQQKLRTFLTITALSIGIALLIIMIAAGNGLKGLVLSQLETFNPNSINIEVRVPGRGSSGSASDFATGVSVTSFKNKDVEEIARHPNIEAVYAYVTGQQTVRYKEVDKTVIVFGYGAQMASVEKVSFEEGRFYTEDEENSLSLVVVLGSKLKETLFGDEDAVGKNIYVKNMPFKVVGVMASQGAQFFFDMDSIIYIPTKTMQKKILGTDYVMGVQAKVKDASKIPETKDDMVFLMREMHDITDPSRDDFEVMTMNEAREMVSTVLNAITLFLAALTFISLIVGGVGITNIMYVTVTERTFEIGLRKSVGARKNDILLQFLGESVIMTFIGGVIGIILGAGVSFLVYYVANSLGLKWPYSVSLFSIVGALAFSIFLGFAFGVYPAKKAAELDPIAALRKE